MNANKQRLHVKFKMCKKYFFANFKPVISCIVLVFALVLLFSIVDMKPVYSVDFQL